MAAVTRICVCYFLTATWSFVALADEIMLQRGRLFSLYSPAACRKVEQAMFALVLHCDFGGKAARFYLKEFPGELDHQLDPRKNVPSKERADAYTSAALRSIVDELDPDMRQRIKLFSTGSVTGDDTDAKFWQEGYVSISGDIDSGGVERIAQCIFLRVLTYRAGVSAVLVSLSENDGLLRRGKMECLGIPAEVPTMLGSLGRNSEGFRFVRTP
jgi:hypothetical protein